MELLTVDRLNISLVSKSVSVELSDDAGETGDTGDTDTGAGEYLHICLSSACSPFILLLRGGAGRLDCEYFYKLCNLIS